MKSKVRACYGFHEGLRYVVFQGNARVARFADRSDAKLFCRAKALEAAAENLLRGRSIGDSVYDALAPILFGVNRPGLRVSEDSR